MITKNGGLAERSNATVLKTVLRGTVTGVRIPEPPLRNLGTSSQDFFFV